MDLSMELPKTKYYEKLKHINKEDLKYVEKDLEFYEKVSIAFLLFGSQKSTIFLILQKLLVLNNNRDSESDFLYNYASTTNDWRSPVVEALSIIKAHRVLRKLGFDKVELHAVYLPHIAEITVNIHPILKTLYMICERLTPAMAGKLILEIGNDSTLRFYDHSYLEIYLLEWVTRSIIDIGEYDFNSQQGKTTPNLDILIGYFKEHGFVTINELLLSAINRFTVSFSPSIQPKRNENNLALDRISNVSDANSSSSFERKESIDRSNYDMSYKIRKDSAGFILIINQMNFHSETNSELEDLLPPRPLKPRLGSNIDQEILEKTFASFGYKPIVRKDQKHHEIMPIVKDYVNRSVGYDSLIVCVLSHGAEGVVYGSNSIPLEISRIKDLLTADSLLDKPKLLIVQACQGTELQEAKKIPNLESDGPNSAASLADMLIVMSTVPGFASVRHKIKGTWFIQSLCKQIDKYGDSTHISDILTFVFNEVQSKRGMDNECMVPTQSSTLKKHLYLPKRY